MPNASWDDVRGELASCYTSILEEANKNEDIKSIAFCSISTGLFGVPITIGSEVAIKTIQSYLETHEHHFEEIIIDVFSEEDYNEYCNTARKINKER
jgi:O-acetyl-ADP-ribose deacetylase (regulator of RNase III)